MFILLGISNIDQKLTDLIFELFNNKSEDNNNLVYLWTELYCS